MAFLAKLFSRGAALFRALTMQEGTGVDQGLTHPFIHLPPPQPQGCKWEGLGPSGVLLWGEGIFRAGLGEVTQAAGG